MRTYEKSSFIACSAKALFDFHLDVNNLTKISPPNIDVTLLQAPSEPKEGEVIKLRTVKNFLPTTWEVQIKTLRAPTLFVDKALKSPFSLWEHHHIFTPKEGGCELKDIVHFSLPLGFLGGMLHGFVEKELEEMFAFRHDVTKKLLETS